MNPILIVDDDVNFCEAAASYLQAFNFSVLTANSLAEARDAYGEYAPKVVLLDVHLSDGSGLDLLPDIDPDHSLIIVMTAHPTLDIAVDSLRARVADFLSKPLTPQKLLETIRNHAERFASGEQSSAQADTREASREPDHSAATDTLEFVGQSAPMRQVFKLIQRVGPSQANVFIQGASGTGKELVAQSIHLHSKRADKPFLGINCGAVSTELIASELFGHEKGSFTGALQQHKGHFERANGGTLFLDEVTEMPLELQVKLLRVLETNELLRVGGSEPIKLDVRIIAATNRDPRQAIEDGFLREDLYFRLGVFPIHLPSLQERGEDITRLAEHFLSQLNAAEGSHKSFSEGATRALKDYSWPGNVRQLKNVVERSFIIAEQCIEADDLLLEDTEVATATTAGPGDLAFDVGSTPINELERQAIIKTINHYQGNKTRAAETLGISLKTLYNKLKQYEIQNLSETPD